MPLGEWIVNAKDTQPHNLRRVIESYQHLSAIERHRRVGIRENSLYQTIRTISTDWSYVSSSLFASSSVPPPETSSEVHVRSSAEWKEKSQSLSESLQDAKTPAAPPIDKGTLVLSNLNQLLATIPEQYSKIAGLIQARYAKLVDIHSKGQFGTMYKRYNKCDHQMRKANQARVDGREERWNRRDRLHGEGRGAQQQQDLAYCEHCEILDRLDYIESLLRTSEGSSTLLASLLFQCCSMQLATTIQSYRKLHPTIRSIVATMSDYLNTRDAFDRIDIVFQPKRRVLIRNNTNRADRNNNDPGTFVAPRYIYVDEDGDRVDDWCDIFAFDGLSSSSKGQDATLKTINDAWDDYRSNSQYQLYSSKVVQLMMTKNRYPSNPPESLDHSVPAPTSKVASCTTIHNKPSGMCNRCCKPLQEAQPQLLICGHVFCVKCIAITRSHGNHNHCPNCQMASPFDLSHVPYIPDARKPSSSKLARVVQDIQNVLTGNVGNDETKMISTSTATTTTTSQTKQDAKTLKCLVFSQWRDVLELLEPILDAHGIRYVPCKTPTEQAIAEFVNPESSYQLLLLPLKTCNHGLNLPQAQHVFLLEPTLLSALEEQAIARVRRLDQEFPTYVHRYMVEGTIEVPMYELIHQNNRESDLTRQSLYQVFEAMISPSSSASSSSN